jgi:ribosomal protein S18 acetylase RimI-like enzyme/ribosomal protein S27AE
MSLHAHGTFMQVRQAVPEDAGAVQGVAERSMEASYSLSPSAIEGAAASWYGDDAFAEKLDDDGLLVLVVEQDDGVVAFSESTLVSDRGDVLWLHVDPVYRGQGLGADLYDATLEALAARGAESYRGRVLADNAQGNHFYERQGLTKFGEGHVEVDGEEYIENIYAEPTEEDSLMATTGPEGEELYVDRNDSDRGSKAEFLVVYNDAGRERRWGFFCPNCETFVTSMDAMGRMECGTCGNQRRPTRWDSAYL